MPLRRAYAPVMPELDSFLFASVGKEVDGVPLSVLSALTQLGFDPRDEAARLSRLSREAAISQLEGMIARLSNRRWTVGQARTIASELAARLPKVRAGDGVGQVEGDAKQSTGSRVPVLLIYLAVGGAVLISLFVHWGVFS